VKFSTGVPNCREGRLNPIGSVDPAWMSDVAQAAEQLGYYSLWLNEFLETEPNVRVRFDNPPNYYDALTTLGYLAAQTRRIRFLPSVLVLPLHHPILLNRQAATLDVLSGGRLTLGVGLGGSREDYRRLRGELGAVNRGQMMDEFVQALRALWTDVQRSARTFPRNCLRPLLTTIDGSILPEFAMTSCPLRGANVSRRSSRPMSAAFDRGTPKLGMLR
jgi:alkanesulfonate monooxygenase SsuD/methylene tetrahydromethanopterin reductase-like flavin-dependent oxidoreductase (luciferase family)